MARLPARSYLSDDQELVVNIRHFNVRNLRLEWVAQLLKQDSDSVSHIAFAVNFINLSYFAKCFKRKFGVTPSSFTQDSGSLMMILKNPIFP